MLKVSSLYFTWYNFQYHPYTVDKTFHKLVFYPTPVHRVPSHCYQILMASHQIIEFNYPQ